MAAVSIVVKNRVDIFNKPRVYFTCHPQDFENSFEKISGYLLAKHDCAIYYTKDMEADIPAEERETDLGRANIFVVPVTSLLLTTNNRTMDEDIPYATQNNIPVLPIMMESGIDELYASTKVFGNLQYLNPFSGDTTEISFEEKLFKYLEMMLVSEEEANRIRTAFDAHIFLSYRKKDRHHANRLMRIIHSRPNYRRVAVWFDEFLNPGEDFNENIEKMLAESGLFVLLATPSIFEKIVDNDGAEKDNYVISTELPLALKNREEKGTEILVVEMEETDRKALSKLGVGDCVNVNDKAFDERLEGALLKALKPKEITPERTYLMGLAYLMGIDVEVNRKLGLQLVGEAAEAGHIEAMERLFEMYYFGSGIKTDYEKAYKWIKRMVEACVLEYGEEDKRTIDAMHSLMGFCSSNGKSEEALKYSQKVYEYTLKNASEESGETVRALIDLSRSYLEVGRLDEALSLGQRAHELAKRTLAEDDPEAIFALTNLARAYCFLGKKAETIEFAEKAYAESERLLNPNHTLTLTRLIDIAYFYEKLGDTEAAMEVSLAAHKRCLEAAKEENPVTIRALKHVAINFSELMPGPEALYVCEQLYGLCLRALGEKNTETLDAICALAYMYFRTNKADRAIDCYIKAYKLCLKLFGEDNKRTVAVETDLINTYITFNRGDEAAALLECAFERSLRTKGEDCEETVVALVKYAVYGSDAKKQEQTVQRYEKACDLALRVLGPTHEYTILAVNSLPMVYDAFRIYDKALKAAKKAHRLCAQLLGEKHPKTIEALGNLAAIYKNKGNQKSALECYKSVYEFSLEVFGENDAKTIAAKKALLTAMS